jgi:hypothetical protein
MGIKNKLSNMAVLIEFLVGSALAIYFHWVLNYKQEAYTIFAIGILLSLGTYLLREELASVHEHLADLYRQSHELTYAISQINDAECQAKAKELLGATTKTISLLQKGIIPLEETEFFLEATKAVDQANNLVKAVEPLTSGWSSRGAMLNYYHANLRALERGVKVVRIIVISREDLSEAEVQMMLMTQLNDGIDVRVAYRDELPSEGASIWSDNCSFNFAVYDDHTATDVYSKPGTYYGRKSNQPEEVGKFLRVFGLIEHNAYKIVNENGDIKVVSGGVNGLAAAADPQCTDFRPLVVENGVLTQPIRMKA